MVASCFDCSLLASLAACATQPLQMIQNVTWPFCCSVTDQHCKSKFFVVFFSCPSSVQVHLC
uniref:Secreted protein n=1 Tax=Anguilla anguilla TaxID=7936 RepID=A0A0E9XDE4_ANGAN